MKIRDIKFQKHIKNKKKIMKVILMMMEEKKIENMDGILLENKLIKQIIDNDSIWIKYLLKYN
jgi:glutamate mutase epsilon subunit